MTTSARIAIRRMVSCTPSAVPAACSRSGEREPDPMNGPVQGYVSFVTIL